MQKCCLLLLALLFASSSFASPKGENVYGRIQWVESSPDYKVKVVNTFADLDVQIVTSFPDRMGRWQIVKSLPDYKIQRVTSGEDFKIRFVNAFPGEK